LSIRGYRCLLLLHGFAFRYTTEFSSSFCFAKMIAVGIQKSTILYLYFLEIVHKIFTKVEVYYFIEAVVLKDCTNSHFY